MTRMLAIFLFVAAVAFALGPLATPGFNGFEPDQFPIPQNDPPAQPAGYAFAIWGVIYAWLIVGAGFQLFARHDAPDWQPIRLPLITSLVLGAPWLAVAQLSPVWATVLIWLMWGFAVLAFLRAPARDDWFGHWPVGLYAGWLTGAASVSLALLAAGHGLTGPVTAAVVVLLLALGLGLAVIRARPSAPGYPIALTWALIGVAVANWPDGSMIALSLALLASVALAFFTLRQS